MFIAFPVAYPHTNIRSTDKMKEELQRINFFGGRMQNALSDLALIDHCLSKDFFAYEPNRPCYLMLNIYLVAI